MLDANSYLAGEIRNLAFRKADEHATWQDAAKQKQEDDVENHLCKVSKNNLLIDLARALRHPFNHSKRGVLESYADRAQTQGQPATLAANLPSHPKAG